MKWVMGLIAISAFGADTPQVTECIARVSVKICTQMYQPAICSASSVDAGRSKVEPMKGIGTNTCHAKNAILAAACRRGLDPSRFKDGDIKCQLDDPAKAP